MMRNRDTSFTTSTTVITGGPSVQVARSNDGDRRRAGSFSEKLLMTCNSENRSFALGLAQEGAMGRVYTVQMEIEENNTKGKDSAKLMVWVEIDHANGATCSIRSVFSRAIMVEKRKIISASMGDTEFIIYKFAKLKLSGCFIVEQKTNAELVEKISVGHVFPISEDEVYHVVIKILVRDKGEGLLVEVEEPVKHAKSFMENLFNKVLGSVGRQQPLNGFGFKDMKLIQSLTSQVNADKQSQMRLVNSNGFRRFGNMQSQTGLINSNGFTSGFGNGSILNDCIIKLPNNYGLS